MSIYKTNSLNLQHSALSKTHMKYILAKATAVLLGLASFSSAESMYNPLKSTVAIYNDKNYDKQVTYNREKGISVVQFYKAGGKSFLTSNSQT